MRDTYEGRKSMASWRRPLQRLAQQGSGGCQRYTAIYTLEIWDHQGPQSSATVHSDYVTMMILKRINSAPVLI